MKGYETQSTTTLTPGGQFQGYNKSVDGNKLTKEEGFSNRNQDVRNVKRRLERELSTVNRDLSEKLSKNRDVRNIMRKYKAMQVLRVHKVPMINEIGTERTM